MPHTALLQPLWDVQKGESVLRLPGFLPLHMMAAPLLSTGQFWLCRLSQYVSKTTKYLCLFVVLYHPLATLNIYIMFSAVSDLKLI